MQHQTEVLNISRS